MRHSTSVTRSIHSRCNLKTRCTVLVVGLGLLWGCGEKTPLPTGIRDSSTGRLLDTAYVAVMPAWTEAGGIHFRRPWGVTVGYDRTIYICDTHNDRIIRVNAQGDLLESFAVPQPVAVAQDRGFNLVCVNQTPIIWARPFLAHGVFEPIFHLDSIKMCRMDPKSGETCAWLQAKPLTVTASPGEDKKFYFSEEWTGKIYRFSLDVPLLTRVADSGLGVGKVISPIGLATMPDQEGYRLIVSQYLDFPGVQFLDNRFLAPVIPGDSADIYRRPLVDYKTVAVDDLGNVYVLHRGAATVMIFTKTGNFVLSFGERGADPLQLKNPSGIAVLDETVLIADTDNDRIVRYQKTAIPEP